MKGILITYLLIILAGIASFIGYVMNIVALIHSIHDPLSTLLVLRIVGVFAAPLGAVLGYF